MTQLAMVPGQVKRGATFSRDGRYRYPLYMPTTARPVGGLFLTPARLPIDLDPAPTPDKESPDV